MLPLLRRLLLLLRFHTPFSPHIGFHDIFVSLSFALLIAITLDIAAAIDTRCFRHGAAGDDTAIAAAYALRHADDA